jgi:hypothetical protein
MIRVDGERLRAEEVYDPPIGAVLKDETGIDQVFLGWRLNTIGKEMVFARAYVDTERPQRSWYQFEPHIYHASMADTLLRKFPGLADYELAEPNSNQTNS